MALRINFHVTILFAVSQNKIKTKYISLVGRGVPLCIQGIPETSLRKQALPTAVKPTLGEKKPFSPCPYPSCIFQKSKLVALVGNEVPNENFQFQIKAT